MSEVIDLLRQMVATPSVSCGVDGVPDNTHGEARMVELIRDFWDSNSVDYELQDVAPGRQNVVAHIGGGAGPVLLLESHMDTVEVEAMEIDPFDPVISHGRLYGRGSCDDKASLAAMLVAARNAGERGMIGTLIMAAVADEECGFSGANRMVEGGIQADGAVIGEPTELELVTAHKGATRLIVRSHGVAAHSSEPLKGTNAIYAMADILCVLRSYADGLSRRPLHPLVGGPTCSVGLIRGGQAPNIVPDTCEIVVDRRMVPGEDTEEVRAEIVDALSQDLESSVNWSEKLLLSDYPLEVSPNCWVVQRVREAVEVITGSISLKGVQFGTDASKFAHIGIPSVVIGPGNIAQAHTACEWVETEQVERAVSIYERVIFG